MRVRLQQTKRWLKFGPVIRPRFSLPFVADFSRFEDGRLPRPFRCSWMASSGKASAPAGASLENKDIFCLLKKSPLADVVCKAAWTIANGSPAGVAVRLDNPHHPKGYLLGYHDGSQAALVEVLGKSSVVLVSALVGYVAGGFVEVRCSGPDVELWYAGARVGATQTTSERALLNNRYHLPFSTSPMNSCSIFSLVAV